MSIHEKDVARDVSATRDFPSAMENSTQEKFVSAEDLPVVEHDGFRLHPQPTSDPLDPLNWSSFRKHSILAIVMALYFMFTAITTITVPSFPQLQTQYGASLGQINWTVAIPALGLATGESGSLLGSHDETHSVQDL